MDREDGQRVITSHYCHKYVEEKKDVEGCDLWDEISNITAATPVLITSCCKPTYKSYNNAQLCNSH